MTHGDVPIIVSRLYNYHAIPRNKKFITFLKKIPIIEPDSRFWVIWRIIVGLYIIFFLLDITLLLTFGKQFWRDQTVIQSLKAFYFIGVAFIATDVFLQFHVGYYDGGVLHKNRKDIFQKKVLIILFVDILSLVILILTYFLYNWALVVLKIIFFIKIVRLHDINKEFQQMCLLHRKLRLIYQLFKMTMIFFLYCHLIGCLFYGLDLLMYYYVPSYVQNDYLWIINCPAYPNIMKQYWFVKYLYALYWAIASTSTVGYGDIYPKNPIGNFLIVLSNISICIIFGVFARSIIKSFQNYNQISINLKSQIKMLKQYFKIKRVSNELGRRIRRFIQFKALLEGLKQQSKIQAFKNKLSPQIKSKLCYSLYKIFLNDLPFAKTQQKQLALSTHIKQKTFFEGQILNYNNSQRAIYYIRQGYVLSYYELRRSSYQLSVLTTNSKIMVFDYVTGFPSNISYKFISHCQTLVIEGQPMLTSKQDNQQYQKVKTDLIIYGNTQYINIKCSICQGYHLQHNCEALFPKPSINLSQNQDIENKRLFKKRHNYKLRITDGIGYIRIRQQVHIDKVSNFQKYYSNYNILAN